MSQIKSDDTLRKQINELSEAVKQMSGDDNLKKKINKFKD